jgi:hypothetical protein
VTVEFLTIRGAADETDCAATVVMASNVSLSPQFILIQLDLRFLTRFARMSALYHGKRVLDIYGETTTHPDRAPIRNMSFYQIVLKSGECIPPIQTADPFVADF